MQADDLFRIYSMTKPIVSAAAMILVDEGKVELDAPVSKYIPSFATVKFAEAKIDASGLTYGFFGDSLA